MATDEFIFLTYPGKGKDPDARPHSRETSVAPGAKANQHPGTSPEPAMETDTGSDTDTFDFLL